MSKKQRTNPLSFTGIAIRVHNYVGDEVGHIENEDGQLIFVAACGGDVFTLDEILAIASKMAELEQAE